MQSIIENKVDWSILSNTLELALPIPAKDYPITVQIFDESDVIIQETEFKKPPIFLKNISPPGTYRYIVVSNNQAIFSGSIVF